MLTRRIGVLAVFGQLTLGIWLRHHTGQPCLQSGRRNCALTRTSKAFPRPAYVAILVAMRHVITDTTHGNDMLSSVERQLHRVWISQSSVRGHVERPQSSDQTPFINASPDFKPREEFSRGNRFGIAELICAALGR
jgi:hypothetical protein